MSDRFEIRTGKFGQYFFDSQEDQDMPLEQVRRMLEAGDHLRDLNRDLLAACETTAANIRTLRDAHPGLRIYDKWLEVVEAAIAKAREVKP